MTIRRTILLLVCTVLLVPGVPVTAQEPDSVSIRGRILGPSNEPLMNQPVLLHRVQSSQGATIAESLTGADGEFELVTATPTDTSAIYFVATRYEGELYIGPPFRAGDVVGQSQLIQVGVPGTSATALLEGGPAAQAPPQAMGRPLTNRNWLLFLIPLAGVLAVAIYALIPKNHIATDRAMLIRIAELDEKLTTAPDGQRESLLEERSHLATQLRGL